MSDEEFRLLRDLIHAFCGIWFREDALREVLRLEQDLVLLDLHMPRMDGFTFLRLLMARRPTPVVVVSSRSRRTDAFKALELGALDFVAKPDGDASFDTIADALVEKCDLLRSLRVENLPHASARRPADRVPELAEPRCLVAIGASTGGPQALQRLARRSRGICRPGSSSRSTCPSSSRVRSPSGSPARPRSAVQEAQEGDLVAIGRVLVAPGARHLEVRRDRQGALRAALAPPEPRASLRHCPSVDRLFASVARAAERRACAVVLTGMGQDGRAGVAEVKASGGLTLAESQESAIVYGMPQAAAESGALDELLPLEAIAERIVRFAREA